MAALPSMNSDRLRHTESSVYARATRRGSRVFHASSAALTFARAAASSNGGSGGFCSVISILDRLIGRTGGPMSAVRRILGRSSAPTLAMRVLGRALHLRMALAEQQRIRRAHLGTDQ